MIEMADAKLRHFFKVQKKTSVTVSLINFSWFSVLTHLVKEQVNK